jgi:lysozyme
MIARHEGRRNSIYRDSRGIWTIGIGHNVESNGLTIPDEMVDSIFDNDLKNAIDPLQKNLPWFSSLDEVRQAVLIDMSFQLGWPKLSLFKQFLTFLQHGLYFEASREMLNSAWAVQVPDRSKELSWMIEKGVWQK